LSASDLQTEAPGAGAAADCDPDTGLNVLYAIFPTTADAQRSYNLTISEGTSSGLPTGLCNQRNDVQGTYQTRDTNTTIGKLACFTSSGSQIVLWWHYKDNILALAKSGSLSLSAMMTDWANLGPS
jgi:hypothetical protein